MGKQPFGRQRDPQRERKWRDVIARRTKSRLSVREFCEGEGLAVSTYHFWRRELERRDSEAAGSRTQEITSSLPTFIPVSLGGRVPAGIEIEFVNGTIVRVPCGCDENSLRVALSALESASC